MSSDSSFCLSSHKVLGLKLAPPLSPNIGGAQFKNLHVDVKETVTVTPDYTATCLGCIVVPILSQWKEGILGHQMFLCAWSRMLLPLQISLMAQVNHTAIRAKTSPRKRMR